MFCQKCQSPIATGEGMEAEKLVEQTGAEKDSIVGTLDTLAVTVELRHKVGERGFEACRAWEQMRSDGRIGRAKNRSLSVGAGKECS